MNNRSKNVILVSFILNLVIFLLEAFALSEVFFRFLPNTEPFKWYYSLTYYTNLSNILLFFGSLSCLINDLINLKTNKTNIFPFYFKFTGVITTLVTFLTVYVFVIITKDITYAVSIHGNMWLLLHSICPLLGFISFFFFDDKRNYTIKLILIPYILTWLYTLMVIILFLNNNRIPYQADISDFEISIPFIILCGFIESTLSFLIAFFGKLIFFLQKPKMKRKYDYLTKNLQKK